MLVPPETLELIRSRLDIAELVGEYVPLTRAGRNLKGRCPFHQERTPSFIVSPERQTFHCFGCGEGGDAFTFVMKSDGLSFVEAIEKLGVRVGVKVETTQEMGPLDKEKIRLKEALDFAAQYYATVLKKDSAAQSARDYVAKRHLNATVVENFQLGYAPKQGSLVSTALKKGFDETTLLKSGLAARRPEGTLRDYFFDRLMFPIRDGKGSVVGFGGRTLGEGEPKYLNSPESPVFSKGRLLYGLYQGLTAIRKSRRVVLMEGYMDVIAAHQYGLNTACAALGTAMTSDHASLIKRYADHAIIIFDADTAGQNAAVRGSEVALTSALNVKIATVSEGKDPDELLHLRGIPALEEVIEHAVDIVDFKTELLIHRAGTMTSEKKSAIAKEVMATIVLCPDEVLKDEWVRRLAQRLGVNEESLRRVGGKAVAQIRKSPAQQGAASQSSPKPLAEIPANDLQLLGLMFKAPHLSQEVEDDVFDSGVARLILMNLREVQPYDKSWGPKLLALLPEAESAVASRLLADELSYDDPDQVLKMMLGKRARQKRLKEIEPLVLSMGAGQPIDTGLRDEYQRLVVELKGSKR